MKILLRAMILVFVLGTTGCLHAPRTAWTPKEYKKKPYKPKVR